MKEKEYLLVNHLSKKYFFTSQGFNDDIPYSEMLLFRFFNDEFSFHILGISENSTMVFGDDVPFYHWLKGKGVITHEYEIFNYAVVEPMSKMHKLVCSTKDDLLVEISISSLNFDGGGSITTKEDEPKLVFQFAFGEDDALPILKKLKDEKPEILWQVKSENDQLPDEVTKYYEELAEKEKNNELIGGIVIFIFIGVVAYILYSIFS